REFKAMGTEGQYETEVCDRDGPAQLFFKEFSGDPFAPTRRAAAEPLGKLLRTEGKMRFHTYLAVVNRGSRSVVTLWEHHWTLTWDGAYDFLSGTWTSASIESFLDQRDCDAAEKYENLTAGSATPFSLFVETAGRFWEVETVSGWIPWKNGK